MSIPGSASPLFLSAAAAAAPAGYEISRSLRFNSADSAYLSRTPSSAGNRKTWTWSGWFKNSVSGAANQRIFSAKSGSSQTEINFDSNGRLFLYEGPTDCYVYTQANLRDPSAWYHFVVVYNTTQSSMSDRVKIYINGVLQDTTQTGSDIPQNTEGSINNTYDHRIGSYATVGSPYLDACLAEVNFIDGQALAPTDFGEYDDNNVWQPKAYAGTYGTNGFHLPFDDNSSNAALGDDSSGNNNDWTVNNLVAAAPGFSTANEGFDVVTYAGNGSTQTISGLNFQPDFVWFKARSGTAGVGNHRVFDVVRGVQKQLLPNLTNAEGTDANTLTAFNSNGFSLGSSDGVNGSGTNYVAWCWKADGTAVSNTDGTITSSVSANTTYGFSVINHTGTGAAGTFGHGLSSAPDWLIFKNREATDNWFVWTRALNSATTGGVLNSANAFFTNGANELNSTLPTDSVIHVGNNLATNGNGQEVICYAWTEVPGFSKFGSYTGDGSTKTITTGFKTAFILVKSYDTVSNWHLLDSERGSAWLEANGSAAENSNSNISITYLDNGFTVNGSNVNNSGTNYIYMAFAGTPDGSVIDSLIDTPTNYEADSGNNNGGNYATWNPLDSNSNHSLSNGNLDLGGYASAARTNGTISVSSGKWYFEVTNTDGWDYVMVGVGPAGTTGSYPGSDSTSWSFLAEGIKYHNGSGTSVSPAGNSAGDIIGVALDLDNGKIYFSVNGVYVGSGDPAAGSNPAYSSVSGTLTPAIRIWNSANSNKNISANFGQRPFSQTVPTGYSSLCTTNLPDPTIADGSAYFDAKLWTGDGSSDRDITGYGFSPDWVWVKRRSTSSNHVLMDTVRGHSKGLYSNLTSAEQNDSSLNAFNSDGFQVNGNGDTNQSGQTFVGWAWDGGTSTVSNTDGSITSSVRANASAGFSIVSYSGSGSSGTVGHGLNAAPELILLKERNGAENWRVHHAGVNDFSKTLFLNLTNAATTNTERISATSSSTFTLSSGGAAINSSSKTYIAYCFAPVAGYSAFGSYTGNGSADGPFVHTGFRPAVIIQKRTDSTGSWTIVDTARDIDNPAALELLPNSSAAEYDNTSLFDILSNGFKVRATFNNLNASGGSFVYAAFAEHPFKTARAR